MEGKIAPTSTGYVEIALDYTKVTVPFRYDISFSTPESALLTDFKLVSYSVDGGTETLVDDPTAPVSDIISPDNATKNRTLKLNFIWFDGTDESSSDILDTNYTRDNENLGMRFNLQFTQLQPLT